MPELLPLTVFEELMLYQDSAAYPCNCFGRFRFDGRLQRGALAAAVKAASARHPMLQSRIVLHRRKPFWNWPEDPESAAIDWHTGDELPAELRLPGIDLQSGPGLRLAVAAGEYSSQLLLQFHHACCDGLGISRFVHDLLVAYAIATGEAPRGVRMPRLDDRTLLDRGSLGLTTGKFLRMLPGQLIGLQGVGQFLLRAPQPVLPQEPVPPGSEAPRPFPSLCSHHFGGTVSGGLRRAAQRLGTTTNGILIRDLFLALQEFRRAQGADRGDQWLRLMIPVSMRRDGDRRTTAANMVSSVFLDRRGQDFQDGRQLLAGVEEEMELIKRRQLGFTFLFSLYAQRAIPCGIRRAAGRAARSCQASAIFTNLGKFLCPSSLPRDGGRAVCGNVRLDQIEIAAPIGPFTSTSFAANWYADQLCISLNYDPRVLTAVQGDQLLGAFIRRIERSAQDGLDPVATDRCLPGMLP